MKATWLAVALTVVSSVGFAVRPFELPWMNAATGPGSVNFKSTDHKNKVFVVEAYFLNCPYCNENASNVNELSEKYESTGRVQVLDVGVDRNDSQYTEWIRRHKPNHPVLKDAKREVISQLGTTGYPSTYVIDCKGTVVGETSGDWGSAELRIIEGAIEEALATECEN